MSDTTPTDRAFADAYHLCKKHGLFFTEVIDVVFDKKLGVNRPVKGWVVYRAGAPGERPIRLGRRRKPRALLAFVKQLTGTP